jgi:LysM repeat protein
MKRVLLIVTLTLMLLALSPVRTAQTHAPSQEILCEHIVRAGESIFCIARAYGVDPYAIVRENGLLSPNLIYAGMSLHIPNVPAELPPGPVCVRQCEGNATITPVPEVLQCGGCTCAAEHSVIYGETLTSIALFYGVNLWRLAGCNCIHNLNFVTAGEQLCIPLSE